MLWASVSHTVRAADNHQDTIPTPRALSIKTPPPRPGPVPEPQHPEPLPDPPVPVDPFPVPPVPVDPFPLPPSASGTGNLRPGISIPVFYDPLISIAYPETALIDFLQVEQLLVAVVNIFPTYDAGFFDLGSFFAPEMVSSPLQLFDALTTGEQFPVPDILLEANEHIMGEMELSVSFIDQTPGEIPMGNNGNDNNPEEMCALVTPPCDEMNGNDPTTWGSFPWFASHLCWVDACIPGLGGDGFGETAAVGNNILGAVYNGGEEEGSCVTHSLMRYGCNPTGGSCHWKHLLDHETPANTLSVMVVWGKNQYFGTTVNGLADSNLFYMSVGATTE